MSIFKLEKLIGEGARGYVRRVGNTNTPLRFGNSNSGKPVSGGGAGGNLKSMIQRKPEVLVKISGFGRGKGVRGALDYVGRDGKLALELQDGSKVEGKEETAQLAKEWEEGTRRRSAKQRDTMNLVLSMPPGTDEKRVLEATRAFAQQTFADKRDYAMVQHTDEKHPHVHIIVKMQGYDGKRLDPKKADLQQWRENFAEQLRERGVECAATPRRARGITKKPQDQEHIHMQKRGQRADIETKKIKDAIQDLAKGAPPKAWDKAILARRQAINKIYEGAAKELQQSTDPADRITAAEIKAFIAVMPPPLTRRQELQQAMRTELNRSRESQQPATTVPKDTSDLDR